MRHYFSFPLQSLTFATFCLALTACQQPPNYGKIEGKTMGTSYHISFALPKGADTAQIQQRIDARLVAINKSMSTYDDTSTIMQFNRANVGEVINIDPDFVQVMADSKQVYQASKGAFDPTVLPLVKLWGFGGKMTVERLNAPPSQAEIEQAKGLLGFDNVIVKDQTIQKTKQGVALDFSAVAKGYGVDVIANVLKNDYKINDYMVEIGGEVATQGKNPQGQGWQLGIDAPVLNSTVTDRQNIAIIAQPTNAKLNIATSGNYRNSLVYGNERISHTIDPTTGKPIVGGAPSVTVAHDTTSLADAWATALTAMPYDKALQLATSQNLAVLFVVHKPNTATQDSHRLEDWDVVETPAMKALRANNAKP
ncbi:MULTISPECIES: FAD:protein FMN transferase [unclassified Moraxella]|uniref:FAD:protein FMN transferase n=1 Tax=unclassified Moraxella TaxID=2685852 RepID=UPI003AF98647